MVLFVLGVLVGAVGLLLWLGAPAIAASFRRGGWTWAELRRPIAWDGPWTDGWRWSYGMADSRMVWPSVTGRRLVSHGNVSGDLAIWRSGTAVFS